MMNSVIPKTVIGGYKLAIGLGGIYGLYHGMHMGLKNATSICFAKKKLSPIEYGGEVFCYGMIMVSSSLYGLTMGSLYVAFFPVTFPLAYTILSRIRKHPETN